MEILDGRKPRARCTELLKERIAGLPRTPTLAIIQVGDRADSNAYVTAKKSYAQTIGAQVLHARFDETVSQDTLMSEVFKYNADPLIQGIIVQLPLPQHIDADVILQSIDPKKDVDGLVQETSFMPATARGIRELLSFYGISFKGKKVTVVGRSKLVGMPIAEMCRTEGAEVTVCHSKTENPEQETSKADILIVAAGKPGLIGKEHVQKGQVVIDVGITRLKEGTLAGDVRFEEVQDRVEKVTPVPGGVGQMTVVALFENLIDACYTFSSSQ